MTLMAESSCACVLFLRTWYSQHQQSTIYIDISFILHPPCALFWRMAPSFNTLKIIVSEKEEVVVEFVGCVLEGVSL